MARQSYTSPTLGGTDPPHRGGVRPPSSPQHHEAKERVQFKFEPKVGGFAGDRLGIGIMWAP